METYDETQVMQLLQEPLTRRKAFEIIVRKYREPLYWKIRRIVLSHDDADDEPFDSKISDTTLTIGSYVFGIKHSIALLAKFPCPSSLLPGAPARIS